MRVRIVSDLHAEFGWHTDPMVPRQPNDDEAILILAGDINTGTQACDEFIPEMCDRFSHVIYVLGNHEFCRHDLLDLADRVRGEMAGYPNFSLLDRGVLDIGNVRFIGTTLWTNLFNEFSNDAARRSMVEYHRHYGAQYGKERLSPDHTTAIHLGDVAFLIRELLRPWGGTRFVITHHLPSYESVDEKYRHGPGVALNPAFYSGLDTLVEKANYWVHGHTHSSFDYKIGDCRVIANPRGYMNGRENPEFDPKFAVEL